MARNWTEEQRAAFELTNRNILVAAAAGSGKTAVLVERIIRKITDATHPVNVDELVVVTFTNAAAAEMKQRIRQAIDELVEQEPDNMHLVKQLTLINQAQITTIDSFCLNLIRNHFTEVNLDPVFRTADEGELKLLENDVMEDMLEAYYTSEDENFYQFVDAYGTGRDDSAIEDMILKLYRFARSNPWPEQWYDMCMQPYLDSGLEESNAFRFLFRNIRNVLTDYEALYVKLSEICRGAHGPLMYLEAIESDLAGIRQLLGADTFFELARRTRLISFDALGRKKVEDVDEDRKKYVQDMRNGYKKYVNETLLGKIFVGDADAMMRDLKDNSRAVLLLIHMAKDFSERMQKEKRQRNIIDFNDMEHLALDILVRDEDGKKSYTDVAKSMAARYQEIMIDEYQDSNLLQEAILTAVSKSAYDDGTNNVYMVGDVKQSIYKFRLACPDLFIDKYDRYQSFREGDSDLTKIELQMNFRSRRNVLECTNDVFRRVMNKDFCGIEYNDAARLNTGFPYPEETQDCQGDSMGKLNYGMKKHAATEVVLIGTPDIASKDAREIEGAQIASMIQKMMTDTEVYDVKLQDYRKIRYSDIVILTRSVKDWADVFVNELMNMGIPSYCESNAGYFATSEIKNIMNFLSIIDNPTKDIEMTGVMLSYFGGFSVEELTRIRLVSKKESLYQQLKLVVRELQPGISDETTGEQQASKPNTENTNEVGISQELVRKADAFLDKINIFRKKSEYMSIQELVWEVIYDTGYYDYVGTMPAGKQRQANVDILLQRASSFETTSYSGLFNFLRYVDRMKKSEVDYGEASVLGENENLVRVMSIHKSKGLEFPVVFVAGMHKRMNFMDASGNIIIDGDLGIGMDVVRLDQRTKGKTVVKGAIARKLIADTIGEEQRVLYVAMTRAREKLIMTGVDKDAEKAMAKWTAKADELQLTDAFTYLDNENFKTYFDMVMPVALLSKDKNLGDFQIRVIENAVADERLDEEDNTELKEDNSQMENGNEKITERLYPPYGYETETNKKLKITVSELKQMQHEADMDRKAMLEPHLADALEQSEEKPAQNEQSSQAVVPVFIAGKQEKLAGNERGTAYHRVMECLDYGMTESKDQIQQCIELMVEDERMTRMQADSVDAGDIQIFCDSTIGKRVRAAEEAGCVRREQPFVFRPLGRTGEEPLDQLVQGVIDLYFEEDGALVIVDYKTDRVTKGRSGEEILKERYTIQLDYYAKALEQLTGKKVKERVIYSFTLGKEIAV
ncbi:MAG: helicase-exonuclease AddAB subunit AddA [Lachnospira sp.]|nr:helicase-exonuclease AddAB subunit AddA [Lachnospira sp.]